MQQEQRKAGSEVSRKRPTDLIAPPQEDEIAALKLELEQKGVQYAFRRMWTSMASPRAKAFRSLILSARCAGQSCSPGLRWTVWGKIPTMTSWRSTRTQEG